MKLRKICVPMSGRYDPHDPGNLDGPVFGVALRYAEAFGALVEVLCVTEPAAPGLSAWTASGAMPWKACLRRRNSLETCVTHTPGQLNVVSPKEPLKTSATNITLPWNNSAASARAVAAALPLMARPKAATTIIASEKDVTELRCENLAGYLSLHGPDADVRMRHADKRTSARAILGVAVDQGSDLPVLGGVTHRPAHRSAGPDRRRQLGSRASGSSGAMRRARSAFRMTATSMISWASAP